MQLYRKMFTHIHKYMHTSMKYYVHANIHIYICIIYIWCQQGYVASPLGHLTGYVTVY